MSSGTPPSGRPPPYPDSTPVRLGNDVVDLEHPSVAGRGDHSRLEARILTPAEDRWLEQASGPEARVLRLWALWAAKETGYKVLSKLSPDLPVFRHRSFECQLEGTSLLPGETGPVTPSEGVLELRGEVRCGELEVSLTGWAAPGFIHLAGTNMPPGPVRNRPRMEMGMERILESSRAEEGVRLEEMRGEFSSREWEGIHGLPSARARLLARRRLADHLGNAVQKVEILTSGERPGRTPPRFVLDGEPRPDLDISLSHHGRYVAWALLLPKDSFVEG